MKKVLILLMCICSLSVFAKKSPVSVISGKLDFLKSESVVKLVYDYSQAKWEEDEDYQKWCEEGNDYERRVKIGYDSFIEGFNSVSGKAKINNDSAQADFTMTISLSNLERKQGPGIWGSMFNRVYGKAVVVNNTTGETICTILIDGVRGDTDFAIYDRMAKCFLELGKNIANLK